MKYKHIEASREARLWITQIVGPSILLAASMMGYPEIRSAVVEKIKNFGSRKQ